MSLHPSRNILNLLMAGRRLRDTNPERAGVNGLEHALQCATLAEQAGADDELVCCALLHDAAKPLDMVRHGEVIAEILRGSVSEARCEVLRTHGAFQADVVAGRVTDRHRWPTGWVDDALALQEWDAASFDPDRHARPLDHFAGRVARIAALAVLVLLFAGCASSSPPRSTPAPSPARLTAPLNKRALPNPTLTPGALNPNVTQANIATTICTRGYTTKVRPSLYAGLHLKTQAMAAYHVTGYHDFEGDHLIALELGGAPLTLANYWPEPWAAKGTQRVPKGQGAEAKDVIENALHRRVCNGTMSLADAQHRIATDWTTALH